VDLKAFIRDVPDFPAPGILFRDITPLLHDPAAVAYAVDAMTSLAAGLAPEAVVAIESRGFLFGMPMAMRLGVPFVPVRKPGKLPSARMSVEYALEYAQGQLDIHADALAPGQRAVIVDDLLATGGTARAACELVRMLGAAPVGAVFLIELEALSGRGAVAPVPVKTVISYP
jgi:adenine phosphoribosyltransferase